MTGDRRNDRQTEQNLVRAFAELFEQVEPTTPEEIDETLRSAGYDPEETERQFAALARQALEQSSLNWRNRAKALETEQARLRQRDLNAITGDSRETLIGKIKQLLMSSGPQLHLASVHFRNFDEASDEDLASFLAELEYLVSEEEKTDSTEE